MLLENLFYAFAVAIVGVFLWTAALVFGLWVYQRVKRPGIAEGKA